MSDLADNEKIAQFVDMIGVSPFANEFTGNPELFKKRLFEKSAMETGYSHLKSSPLMDEVSSENVPQTLQDLGTVFQNLTPDEQVEFFNQ